MSDTHGTPAEDMNCMVTWEEITNESYVEYQVFPSMKWYPSKFGEPAVRELLLTQYSLYIENVQKSDCIKEFTRLMACGPPIWITDAHGLPLDGDGTHIVNLWFMNGDKTESAKLKGAVEGSERQDLWDEMKSFMDTVKDRDEAKKQWRQEEQNYIPISVPVDPNKKLSNTGITKERQDLK